MTTSPSGADGGAPPVALPAPVPVAEEGYAPPTTGPVRGGRVSPSGPFVRRGVPGGVVAMVAAGTGAIGLVAGLVIGGARADGRAGTASVPASELTADLAVAGAPPSTDGPAGEAAVAESAAAGPGSAAGGAESSVARAPERPAVRALADGEGSRDNPLPVGTPVSTAEWQVALGAPREAGDEIEAENQFNGAPPTGMEYWIVPVTATYTGTESGHAGTDLGIGFVGSDARTYSDMCGVVPDDLWDIDEIYGGGTATGNVCVVVPAGAHGLWTVTPGWSAEPVFFAGR
ncbi:hypothetical protein KZX45_14195 [Georgenia sp. EYE_87]|uniref:hypothetical protein n=1 Tax=Georgenia sp. EYE_87 TaxID=2853448 RepID=UPI002004940F|nr:hypothetical protein [Georgenia sp. EYE_87]MCK6211697.1 hypothetical protein [Georgenia sp. EYE_87]